MTDHKDLTLDPEELRKRWMELYVNICVIRSSDPEKQSRLMYYQDRIKKMNELMMLFFDVMGEIVK